MSLSDNADERVEGELQSFLVEYKWLRELNLLEINSEDLKDHDETGAYDIKE